VIDKRPVNLDLTRLSFPPMAIASILHRISGVLLFIGLPFMLYCLSLSLQSSVTFDHLQGLLQSHTYMALLWILGAALIYHALAGVRHLLMDMGVGEQLQTGRWSAYFVMLLSLILTVLLGIRLCSAI
jgi:succinate dehydrogenase / fumarate reductase cytochrome b subunit